MAAEACHTLSLSSMSLPPIPPRGPDRETRWGTDSFLFGWTPSRFRVIGRQGDRVIEPTSRAAYAFLPSWWRSHIRTHPPNKPIA
eukprot:1195802-Prorocentrum_minimum.AAC.5